MDKGKFIINSGNVAGQCVGDGQAVSMHFSGNEEKETLPIEDVKSVVEKVRKRNIQFASESELTLVNRVCDMILERLEP